MTKCARRRSTLLLAALGTQALAWAAQPEVPLIPAVAVADLLKRDLRADGSEWVTMQTVEYAPGSGSQPHQHHAEVFVYVLSGTWLTQLEGQPPQWLQAGQAFHEAPDDTHVQPSNPSATETTKLLVFEVHCASATSR